MINQTLKLETDIPLPTKTYSFEQNVEGMTIIGTSGCTKRCGELVASFIDGVNCGAFPGGQQSAIMAIDRANEAGCAAQILVIR